jgi:heme exporter protein D
MQLFFPIARLLTLLGRSVKKASDDARAADEAKWLTPTGYSWAEPWNDLDPPSTLSASEASQYCPEKALERQASAALGIFVGVMCLVVGSFAYFVQYYWLVAICGIIAAGSTAQTIMRRRELLEEATTEVRRQRRQAKFDLAVAEGFACSNCRRGKPKSAMSCPACGFNMSAYLAERAAKKAVRSAVKATARLTAKAAWFTTKTTWVVTKGTAKALWWALTPTKKRTSNRR